MESNGPQRDLFTQPARLAPQLQAVAPPAPSGPPAETFTVEDGLPPAFVKFIDTDDGREFWERLERAALAAGSSGETRFSARVFLGRYRDDQRVRINDHFSPWFADLLVALHPNLTDIIERRRRSKRSPFANPETLSRVLAVLSSGQGH